MVLSRLRGTTVTVAAMAFALTWAFSGGAVAQEHGRKPPPYTTHGRGPLRAGCFDATFRGNGGWQTHYSWAYTDPYGTATQDYGDSSVYSWDLRDQMGSGASCDVRVQPGVLHYPPLAAGGGSFDAGSERLGYTVDEVTHQVLPTPQGTTTTVRCHDGLTARSGNGSSPGTAFSAASFTAQVKRGSVFIFTLEGTPFVPSSQSQSCPESYARPGASLVSGGVGPFFKASSAPIPIKAFLSSRQVVVSIASDPQNAGKANCGITRATFSGPSYEPLPKCRQVGVWSGTITFTRG